MNKKQLGVFASIIVLLVVIAFSVSNPTGLVTEKTVDPETLKTPADKKLEEFVKTCSAQTAEECGQEEIMQAMVEYAQDLEQQSVNDYMQNGYMRMDPKPTLD